MNGQDPEFEPPRLSDLLNGVSYVLAHASIAMFAFFAFVLAVTVLIGII